MLFFRGRQRILDAEGTPVSGALANFYLTGTTTRATLYSNEDLDSTLTNPVEADSAGFLPPIYLSPEFVYRVEITDRLGGVLPDGVVDPFAPSPTTRTTIGSVLNPPTPAEQALGIVPTDTAYKAYDLPRYGAVLNGVANDGPAVRNWLLASIQAGAEATCSIGGTALCSTFTAVDTASPVRINAPGLTLRGPSTRADFIRPGGRVDLKGVTLDRWLSIGERETSDSGSITHFEVNGVRITDATSIAFNIQRPISNFTFANSEFENTDGGYAIRVGENTYASQDTWQKGHFSYLHFSDIDGAGSASTSPLLVYGKDITVGHVIVDGVAQAGTGEAWGMYTKVRYGSVSFCHVNDVTTNSSTDIAGINIKGDTRASTTAPQGYANLAIGNFIRNVGVNGTRGRGIRFQSDEGRAAFNFLEDTGIDGMTFDEPDANYQGSYCNTIKFNTNHASTVGYRISTGGKGFQAIGDTIVGAFRGFRVSAGGGSADMSNLQIIAPYIENNSEAGTKIGVDFNTLDVGNISGVSVVLGDFASSTNGIQHNGGTLTNVRYLDNNMRGVTGAHFGGTLPADVEIRHTFTYQTTDNANNAAMAITLADESAYRVRIEVVAKESDSSNRAMYHRSALVYRDGAGSATLQGSVADIETPVESNANWNSTIAVTGNQLVIRAQGDTGVTVNWKITLYIIGAP
jgi:hypothetical protein